MTTLPSFSIERWLRVVPRRHLAGTEYGHAPGAGIPPEIREQGMLRQVYLMDLALFLGAERVSTQVASALVRHAPDEAAMTFLATQTLDEARHFEAFAHRFEELGISPERRDRIGQDLLSPHYRAFLDLLLENADSGDFEAGVVGLNVILEGMAFPLYDYEMRYWRPFDPGLVQIIGGAFKDECRHVSFGEHHLARITDAAVKRRVQRKVDDLGNKMHDVFKEFLTAFVGFYDLAIQEYPERAAQVEILPGRRLVETSAEEQVKWLEMQIRRGHEERLVRLGLEAA